MGSLLPHEMYDAGRRVADMYRAFFECAPLGCVLADDTGRFLLVNESFADIHGRTPRDTLDLKYQNITPKELEAEDEEQMEKLWKTGRSGPFEKTYILEDGSLVPIRVMLGQVLVGGQEMIWSVVEKVEPRMSLVLYRLLFQSAPVALALLEFNSGMHIDVNKAYETLVGWSTDELLTMSYLEIMPEDEQPDGAVARAKEELQERGKYGPFSAVYKKKKTEGDSTQTIKVTLNWVRIRWQNRDFIWSLSWPRTTLQEVPLDDFPLPELSPPKTAVLDKMGQVPLEPPTVSVNRAD
jgi:PAS domain S-box-containing protein